MQPEVTHPLPQGRPILIEPPIDLPIGEFLDDPLFGDHIYRQALQDLPSAIYICDAQGRIRFYNQAAVKLWGRSPMVGRDLWCGSFRIYRPDGTELPLDECPMAITLKEGRPVRDVEIIVERPDGLRRNILPYPSPIYDASGRIVGAINMFVDVTDRKQEREARKAAEIAQAKLGAIVESSEDAIVGKTLNGIITSWNRGAQRLFGYTEPEALGQSVFMLIPPQRHQEEFGILSRLRKGERVESFDTQRLTKDGRLVDISLTVSPVRDSRGNIIGASKIARDITERKRMWREREKLLESERHAREEALRVNRMKDDFLATLSHELRTPLNAIMGWAQLMAGGTLTAADMKNAGQVIERNARLQKQLIDDLLDMSRIVSGKLRLDVQEIEAKSFIEPAIEMVRGLAEAKEIEIEKELEPFPVPLSGDPARLQQVIWNLLTNAIKFTSKGGRVCVKLRQSNRGVEITVSDTGQGIEPEFLPFVFARFCQADGSTSRRHDGLGLGLSIVKELTELHGGSVRAQSSGKGKGAQFVLYLPQRDIRPARKQMIDAVSAAPPDSFEVDLSSLTILLVDNEPDAREFVRRLLSESGAHVVTAESAAEALQWLTNHVPDVLVSDIGMPEVDGYQLLRKMREIGGAASAGIPAIALTAFARLEDRTHALEAGYNAHVAKPVDPFELLKTIATVAGRSAD
jgi:PAS domain S-box-containing protein